MATLSGSGSSTALLSNARQERYLCYIWDGWQIATVYEKRELDNYGLSWGPDDEPAGIPLDLIRAGVVHRA